MARGAGGAPGRLSGPAAGRRASKVTGSAASEPWRSVALPRSWRRTVWSPPIQRAETHSAEDHSFAKRNRST